MKQLVMNTATPVMAPAVALSLKSFYRSDKSATPLENAKQVLIFAPHIDDETIGLGGMIRKYASNGTNVHIAVITDGNNSNSADGQAKPSLADVRKQELLSIKDLLGISAITYMEYADGNMKDVASSDAFRGLIEKVKPDVIYTTSLIDAHPDHVFSAHLLADALKTTAHKPLLVREYEINCPVPPEFINCVMDITQEFGAKKKATEAFKSQVIAFDGFLALANIKASLVKDPNVRYVETFIESTPARFIESAGNLKKKDLEYYRYFKQANRTITLWWAIFKNIKLKRAFYESR
ncbi:PIG-L deacetylase family protein [Planococcus sp. YIM B11945]|uniref:PIG-L deacetylase family protein n=1 Tax=Planococcus sp. YIM B11945 TaxID=3435410 RepID=UPI003D7E56E2